MSWIGKYLAGIFSCTCIAKQGRERNGWNPRSPVSEYSEILDSNTNNQQLTQTICNKSFVCNVFA